MTKQTWLLNLALLVLTFSLASCFNKEKEEAAPEVAPEATTETVTEEAPVAEEPAAAIVEETPAAGESMDAAPADAAPEAAPAEAPPADQTNNNTQSGSQTGVANNGTNKTDCLDKNKDVLNHDNQKKKDSANIDLNTPNTGCSL